MINGGEGPKYEYGQEDESGAYDDEEDFEMEAQEGEAEEINGKLLQKGS